MITDSGELMLQTPRFVRDTSQLWHRPNISRDEGISVSCCHFLACVSITDLSQFPAGSD